MNLVNKGSVPTCTRQQGNSIIDTTWVNSRPIALIHDWKVNEEAMTYSDHNYIEYSLGDIRLNKKLHTKQNINKPIYPKWILKNFDLDIFTEIIKGYCKDYNNDLNLQNADPNESAVWIKKVMTNASDISMKRMRSQSKRRQVHWWNTEIHEARRICI